MLTPRMLSMGLRRAPGMIQGAARGAMQGVMQAPTTMREALMQQSGPQQGVAEILSQGLPEMMPDLGGATSAASRQRQIADMLLQGAQSQDNTSIAGGLSQLGQAFLARRAGQKADTAEDKQREMASLLLQQAMGQGPESQAARAQLFADSPAALIAQYDAQQAAQAEAAKPQYQEVGDALLRIGPDGVTPVYEAPQQPVAPKYETITLADGEYEIILGQPESLRKVGDSPVKSSLVNVNTGANGPEIGTIPQGYAVVRDSQNPSGYRLEAIPGGPAETEAQGAAVARRSLENTFRTLFLNYKDLQGKGAIRDNEAGIGENISAYAQSTPIGREIGKMVGSEAEGMRETIEALQPAISQAIMSQPGMSARSMDSERELQFFIRSITAPTADVQANYATLHALDSRFGSGQLMNSLLQSGEITPEEYNRITRSPRVAAISGAMDQKINELFTSDQAAAADMTEEDAMELEELRRWKKERGIP